MRRKGPPWQWQLTKEMARIDTEYLERIANRLVAGSYREQAAIWREDDLSSGITKLWIKPSVRLADLRIEQDDHALGLSPGCARDCPPIGGEHEMIDGEALRAHPVLAARPGIRHDPLPS